MYKNLKKVFSVILICVSLFANAAESTENKKMPPPVCTKDKDGKTQCGDKAKESFTKREESNVSRKLKFIDRWF